MCTLWGRTDKYGEKPWGKKKKSSKKGAVALTQGEGGSVVVPGGNEEAGHDGNLVWEIQDVRTRDNQEGEAASSHPEAALWDF